MPATAKIFSTGLSFAVRLPEYTSRGHNLRIYPPSGGCVAALQIACVERPHGVICALHRLPQDAAISANDGRAKNILR